MFVKVPGPKGVLIFLLFLLAESIEQIINGHKNQDWTHRYPEIISHYTEWHYSGIKSLARNDNNNSQHVLRACTCLALF